MSIPAPVLITTADDFASMVKAVATHFHTPYPALKLEPCGVDEWCVYHAPIGKPYGTFNHYYVVRQGTRYRLERRITEHHPHFPQPLRSSHVPVC